MTNENQLDFVRAKLKTVPTREWSKVADQADVTLRTLFNVVNPDKSCHYNTVFKLYCALKKRPAKRKTKAAEVAA